MIKHPDNLCNTTYSNILVKINRITGEAYYFPGDKWRKINYEKSNTEKSNEEYVFMALKYLKRKKKYIVVILSRIPNDGPTK